MKHFTAKSTVALTLGLSLALLLLWVLGDATPPTVQAAVNAAHDGDPRPLGSGYDVGADETGLIVTKHATPDPVKPGAQLTYTIRVTNTSGVTLTATITDTLPPSVVLDETSGGTLMLPGGTPGTTWTVGITWTATFTPGSTWTERVVVTTAMDYIGPLTNVVKVTTHEGATGTVSCVSVVNATVYLPLITRNSPATVVGEYVFVGNPCTIDPCPPGMVYAVSADATHYYLTVAGSWLWENRSWNGYTPEAGDFVTVTGYVDKMIDIFGDPFYNIEVTSLRPAIRPPYTCPTTSTNQYSAGIAFQFDKDDPVRPAYNHADKNLALRSYASNTDPGLQRELVDYGSDDPTQPPQLATLFDPNRVPTFDFYRVHDWNWAPSPEPGTRGDPITTWPVTAIGMQTTPGETLYVPTSGYAIGGGMEVIVLFADEDTIALRYAREDSAGALGYTVHVDNICTDPNLLALYDQLDDPNGPRYVFPNASYDLPNLYDGQSFGIARDTEIVVAIVDTGAFMDTRSCNEWWQIRPGYTGSCPPP